MARSHNVEDLFTIKTRQFEPGFRWVTRAGDSTCYLQRIPVTPGAALRIKARESRKDVRQALNRLRRVAQGYETSKDDGQIMLSIAALASRYGTLYGDMPTPGDRALGTLDDWKVELLRVLDLWEIAHALRSRSREQGTIRRIERRPADPPHPERFVFRPRTSDIDGEVVISSAAERWTAVNLATGAHEEMPIFARMKAGSARTRLWIVFSTLVNRRMVGRLSLALHPFETATASVGLTPHGLLATVYTRLWLDVVTANLETMPVTTRLCKACNTPLSEDATVRAAYCNNGGRCRQAYRRRQLA